MRLRLALVAASLAAFAPVLPASAQEPARGLIAYVRLPAGPPSATAEGTVYVAAPDGSGERSYTTGTAPSLSRDGRVAWSVHDGAWQLVTARLDSTDAPRRRTALPDRDGEFGPGRFGVVGSAWSPSATRIAVRLMEGSTTTLGIVDAEGEGELRRFDFGHLYGSRIVWRDDDALAVGTDGGLKLVGADGSVADVPGAAQGDRPVAWVNGDLVVNGADGIAVLSGGSRAPLLAGATGWDVVADTAVLYTTDTEVGIVTPADGAGTAPRVYDRLPAGAQVVNAVGGTPAPVLEIVDDKGFPALWVAEVPRSGLGGRSSVAEPARASMRRVAAGGDLAYTPALSPDQVVDPGTAPATPAATQPPAAAGPDAGPAPAAAPARLANAPGPVDPPPGRSTFAHALPAADEVSTDARALLVNLLLTVLLMLLITFPSELFNSTLEKHYDEVRGWFGLRGPRREAVARPRAQRVAMFAAYTAAAAVLYALLDRHAAFDGRTARLWLGLAAGMVVVTLTFSAAALLYHRRRGSAGAIEVLPGTLAVAVACVLISRLTRFEPGYMYGIVGGFAFAKALPKRDEGRAALLSSGWVLAAALAAWLLWLPVDAAASAGDPGLLLGLADTTLAAIAVGGVQGLVIGLLPLRSLPGHTIASWSRRAWAALYGVVLFVFLHLLLHPSSGFGADARPVPFFTWLGLFVGFGAVSVAFWAYFARRDAVSSG